MATSENLEIVISVTDKATPEIKNIKKEAQAAGDAVKAAFDNANTALTQAEMKFPSLTKAIQDQKNKQIELKNSAIDTGKALRDEFAGVNVDAVLESQEKVKANNGTLISSANALADSAKESFETVGEASQKAAKEVVKNNNRAAKSVDDFRKTGSRAATRLTQAFLGFVTVSFLARRAFRLIKSTLAAGIGTKEATEQIKTLREALQRTQVAFGTMIKQNPAVLAIFDAIAGKLTQFTDLVINNREFVIKASTAIADFAIKGLKAAKFIVEGFQSIKVVISGAVLAFFGGISALIGGVATGASKAANFMVDVFAKLQKNFENVPFLKDVFAFDQETFKNVRDLSKEIATFADGVTEQLVHEFLEDVDAVGSGFAADLGKMITSAEEAKKDIPKAVDGIQAAVKNWKPENDKDTKAIKDAWESAVESIKTRLKDLKIIFDKSGLPITKFAEVFKSEIAGVVEDAIKFNQEALLPQFVIDSYQLGQNTLTEFGKAVQSALQNAGQTLSFFQQTAAKIGQEKALEFLESDLTGVFQALQRVGEEGSAAGQALKGLLNVTELTEFQQATKSAVDEANRFLAFFAEAEAKLGRVEALKIYGQNLQGVADALNAVGEGGSLAAQSIATLNAEFEAQANAEAFADSLSGAIVSGIKDGIKNAKNLGDALAGIFKAGLETFFNDFFDGLQEQLKSFFQNASGLARGLLAGLFLLGSVLSQRSEATETFTKPQTNVVESVQATRGVVAGPTSIAISEFQRGMFEALQPIHQTLLRIEDILSNNSSAILAV